MAVCDSEDSLPYSVGAEQWAGCILCWTAQDMFYRSIILFWLVLPSTTCGWTHTLD